MIVRAMLYRWMLFYLAEYAAFRRYLYDKDYTMIFLDNIITAFIVYMRSDTVLHKAGARVLQGWRGGAEK
jgi:hypothetical protein